MTKRARSEGSIRSALLELLQPAYHLVEWDHRLQPSSEASLHGALILDDDVPQSAIAPLCCARIGASQVAEGRLVP